MQAQIDADGVGFIGIEVKKPFLAATVGRGGGDALLVDELVLEQPRNDLGDRAAFQPGPGGDIDAGDGLAFAHDVEDQNLIEVPQRPGGWLGRLYEYQFSSRWYMIPSAIVIGKAGLHYD